MKPLTSRAIACIIGFVAVLAASRADAQSEAVDLQLVLAVDTSGSVNEVRFELQKEGYVAAFRNPRVIAAITSGPAKAIAVMMTQWTGPEFQLRVTPWMRISDVASAQAFADAVAEVPRQLFGGGTSISGAIDFAASLFPDSPFQASRRVIDVSGDGSNNRGRPVRMARDEAVDAGININGLPILSLEPSLDRYYEDNVIGGPGSFMIAAKSYETFGDAIVRKLIAEIATIATEQRTAQFQPE